MILIKRTCKKMKELLNGKGYLIGKTLSRQLIKQFLETKILERIREKLSIAHYQEEML